ncbi:Cycloartenol-C-24-methyltransferase [Porphyridium purpureum]|uniref:Methyltransferase n=1 Tax=Porphyridium purpureum TaxID=35688 RepID=A0A5J4YUB2_PORPP|nr:Cycloartenol-C-24-methyltransferase [Porphyridium purpureum]|eukprot:POR1830..scf227_4
MNVKFERLGKFEQEKERNGGENGSADEKEKVEVLTQKYLAQYGGEIETHKRNELSKKGEQKSFVDEYYKVATDFYEYGWGESFHFAVLRKDETWLESMRRHEYYLALRLGLKPGDHVVDLGCGVGGPAMNIARFANCRVTGVTLNQYQVDRAQKIAERRNCADLCHVIRGDFMHTPFSSESIDHVYAIESTCHTVDKVSVFGEAFRILKPGGCFAGYEWVTTSKYDENNEEHVRTRIGIERGNGLPETVPAHVVKDALIKCGFELIDAYDTMENNEVPWWNPFLNNYSLTGLASSRLGRTIFGYIFQVLEFVGVVPKGTHDVHEFLSMGAENLIRGGEMGIYSVGYFFLARKPLRPVNETVKPA